MAYRNIPKKSLKEFAEVAEMPNGWINGPWFDRDGNIKEGMPPCLLAFARLVEAETLARLLFFSKRVQK